LRAVIGGGGERAKIARKNEAEFDSHSEMGEDERGLIKKHVEFQ
jgi:hypothetical protein